MTITCRNCGRTQPKCHGVCACGYAVPENVSINFKDTLEGAAEAYRESLNEEMQALADVDDKRNALGRAEDNCRTAQAARCKARTALAIAAAPNFSHP